MIDAFTAMDMKNLVWDSSIVTILICALIMVKVLADAAYVMIGVIIMRAILIKTSIDGWWEKFQFNGKNIFMNLKRTGFAYSR